MLSVYQSDLGSEIWKGTKSSVGLHEGTLENVRGIILCSRKMVYKIIPSGLKESATFKKPGSPVAYTPYHGRVWHSIYTILKISTLLDNDAGKSILLSVKELQCTKDAVTRSTSLVECPSKAHDHPELQDVTWFVNRDFVGVMSSNEVILAWDRP